MLFDLRTKAHQSYLYQKRAERMTSTSTPVVPEKVFTKPAELLETGFLFLGKYFKYKNEHSFSYVDVSATLTPILCNSRFLFVREQLNAIGDTLLTEGKFDPYRSGQFTNNLYLNRTNNIGDCGFGAITGWDTVNTTIGDPQIQNLKKLWMFALLELGLSNCGYLISAVKSDAQRQKEFLEVKIINDIAKYCECRVPIMNPHMQDHIRTDGPYSRERYFILITHAGLKTYYKSKEFAELGLLTQ